jgi:hypothetical protein
VAGRVVQRAFVPSLSGGSGGETVEDVQDRIDSHNADTTDVHGIADTSVLGALAVQAVTSSNFTLVAGQLAQVDASGGTVTGTLPPADHAAQVVSVCKPDTTVNPVVIQRAGSDVINASVTSVTVALPDEVLTLVSTGSGAWIIHAGQKTLPSLDARFQKQGTAVSAPSVAVTGLPGSTAAMRWVGATTTGAPTTGTHLVGDLAASQDGYIWECTAAGTPGTWASVGSFQSAFTATGGTGAAGQARWCGATTSGGAPTSGTWQVNDVVMGADHNLYACTTAGTPGSWVLIGPAPTTPGHGLVTVNEAPVTPLAYGAVGNGTTFDDAAFTAMMNAMPAAGGHVYLPANRNFKLSQPITLKGNMRWSGGGATAQISNNSSDLMVATMNLAWLHMQDIRLNVAGSGGHILNFGAFGTSKSQIDNVVFTQNAVGKSCLKAAFWLDNFFRSCHLFGGVNRSAPMIDVVSTTDNLGDNTWEDLTLTDASTGTGATTWAMWIEEASPHLAFSNKFRGINFENPCGGALTLRGHINYVVEYCEFWDITIPAINHLLFLRSGNGGLPNYNGRIRGLTRPSGTLAAGVYDIATGPVGSEYYTIIRDCHGSGGAGNFLIDLQHNIGCYVEQCTLVSLGSSYAPILTPLAAAGTSPAAILDPNTSALYAAGVQLTCGTGAGAGDLIKIWANANGWMPASPSCVNISPRNAAAANARLYVSAQSGGVDGFTVAAANAPADGAVLKFSYNVVRAINGG